MPQADELVQVMVPRKMLADVYGFIAARSGAGDDTGGGSLHRGWTRPLIVEAYKEASPRMRAILDLLASHPDEKLYLVDFMADLDEKDPSVINGALGAFGRMTSAKFSPRLPGGEHTWPLTVAKDIRDGNQYYVMPASVAEVIKSSTG